MTQMFQTFETQNDGFFPRLQDDLKTSQQKPTEQHKAKKNDEWTAEFHEFTLVDLKKSQCVFENFAELADLSRPNGSLFWGRREIVIEAFLQIPFEQLYALLHANLLGTATTGLMDRPKLNHLTHENSVG